jgi:FkbM family methyltransferase
MSSVPAPSDDEALISTLPLVYRVGNQLYKYAFPLYRQAYRAFKVYTDRAERRLLRETLFSGAVVVDAGANIGIYSEFFSRCVGPNGAVHSFEPSPESFKRLRSATRKLPNVRLSQAAVGERGGKSELYLSHLLNVDHRAYKAPGDSRVSIPIQMVALDDYFRPGERVDLIKLDVQGYEHHALRGAKRVLADTPNVKLLLEFWPYGLKQAGANWIDLIAALEGEGMVIRQVSSEGLIPFHADSASERADWYVNLFVSRT